MTEVRLFMEFSTNLDLVKVTDLFKSKIEEYELFDFNLVANDSKDSNMKFIVQDGGEDIWLSILIQGYGKNKYGLELSFEAPSYESYANKVYFENKKYGVFLNSMLESKEIDFTWIIMCSSLYPFVEEGITEFFYCKDFETYYHKINALWKVKRSDGLRGLVKKFVDSNYSPLENGLVSGKYNPVLYKKLVSEGFIE